MSEILTADHGKEAGHWYRKTGEPAYTMIGKNGAERPTTLRDARKEGLVPSVTSIIRCAAAPGLTNWMIDQAIMAALTLPRLEGENDTDFMARIKADSKEQARKAAERGTQIHAWVQAGFEGPRMWDEEQARYYISACETLDAECGCQNSWICEQSFATDRYGGKVDLHSNTHLIDIKTTDKDIATLKTWDEHAMQLAAYEIGLGGCNIGVKKCGILYVNSITAESRLIWIPDEDLSKGWKCFNALVDFWYAKTGLEAA
jgi:hypothetical protein